MTNLQEEARQQLFGDRLVQRLSLWGPIAVGGVGAALVLLLGVVPSLLRSGSTQASLQTAQDLAAQLPSVRVQLEQERLRNERIRQQRATLLSLIGRPGTLATFLAEVDRLAALQGVQIDLYEPQIATTPGAGSPPGTPSAPAPGSTPGQPSTGAAGAAQGLQVEGLQRTSLLLSARGAYPALLRFLRSLESLNVLVAQSDLSLALEPVPAAQAASAAAAAGAAPAAAPPAAAPATPAPASATPQGASVGTGSGSASLPPRVVMKLTISLYEPAAGRFTGSRLPGRP